MPDAPPLPVKPCTFGELFPGSLFEIASKEDVGWIYVATTPWVPVPGYVGIAYNLYNGAQVELPFKTKVYCVYITNIEWARTSRRKGLASQCPRRPEPEVPQVVDQMNLFGADDA